MVSMTPRGVVKMVIDRLIDTLNMDLNKGYSVQLGDFGYCRTGLNAKSQAGVDDVDTDTVKLSNRIRMETVPVMATLMIIP